MKRFVRTADGKIFDLEGFKHKETVNGILLTNEIIKEGDTIEGVAVNGDLVKCFDRIRPVKIMKNKTPMVWLRNYHYISIFNRITEFYTKQGDNYVLVWSKERGMI